MWKNVNEASYYIYMDATCIIRNEFQRIRQSISPKRNSDCNGKH